MLPPSQSEARLLQPNMLETELILLSPFLKGKNPYHDPMIIFFFQWHRMHSSKNTQLSTPYWISSNAICATNNLVTGQLCWSTLKTFTFQMHLFTSASIAMNSFTIETKCINMSQSCTSIGKTLLLEVFDFVVYLEWIFCHYFHLFDIIHVTN